VATNGDSWSIATVSNVQLNAGQHILRLVYDTDGASINYISFGVQDLVPVASFTMTPAVGVGVVPLTIQVSATNSFDPDGSIASYAWSFGDGGTATGIAASHFYSTTGTYTVGLSVADNNGLIGTTSAMMRITDGTVLDPAWCLYYFGTTNINPNADPDGSGLSILQDFQAGLNPTNPLSCLRIVSLTCSNATVAISWDSVFGKLYAVDRSTNLLAQPPFVNVSSNIVGHVNTTSYLDTNAPASGASFYRVSVEVW